MSNAPRRYLSMLAALIACRSMACRARATPADGGSDASLKRAASAVDAAPVGVPSAPQESARREDDVITLTMAWNDALAHRNAPALRRVYGEKVRLYEEQIDRETAIARKAAAFERAPDYTQSIRSLKIDRSQPERPSIEFLKTWRTGGKESTIRGVLVFGATSEGGVTRPVIVEESDVVTDAKRLAALKDEGCFGLLHAVVFSTPSGREYRGKDAFTMIACAPPDCDGFEVAAGHVAGEPPSFRRDALFEIDPVKGVVSQASLAEPADPAIVARMKAACAAEFPTLR